MFYDRSRYLPKHAECFIRIMKNNSLALEKQPAETLTRQYEEYLELYWYLVNLFCFVEGSLDEIQP